MVHLHSFEEVDVIHPNLTEGEEFWVHVHDAIE